jgi:hypothetical protein
VVRAVVVPGQIASRICTKCSGPIWDTFYNGRCSAIGRSQDRWTHWLYRNVPFWTACESTREGLHRHGVRNVTIIRYGVATQALRRVGREAFDAASAAGGGCAARAQQTGQSLSQTLAALRGRGVAAHMTIVGGGEMGAALRQEAAQLQLGDSVRFTGLVSEQEKDTILHGSHLLLHTSVREGWGLNVIEANAMGTPAAVYPVAGLRESTLHDQTGLVAAEETPASLADQIAGLLRDDARYQRYRHGAWERAKTMHWNRILPEASEWFEARARGEKAAPQVIP